jgi:hypothetical protein
MHREAGDGAVGDEGGAMIEREHDVGRAGADRQRHHHRAHERTRAFRDEGCGDDKGRRDRHLDREDEEEPNVGSG